MSAPALRDSELWLYLQSPLVISLLAGGLALEEDRKRSLFRISSARRFLTRLRICHKAMPARAGGAPDHPARPWHRSSREMNHARGGHCTW